MFGHKINIKKIIKWLITKETTHHSQSRIGKPIP